MGPLARSLLGWGTLRGVTRSDEVRVILVLVRAGEVIHGSLSARDEAPHQFFGWIELANALEAARRSVSIDRLVDHEPRGAQP